MIFFFRLAIINGTAYWLAEPRHFVPAGSQLDVSYWSRMLHVKGQWTTWWPIRRLVKHNENASISRHDHTLTGALLHIVGPDQEVHRYTLNTTPAHPRTDPAPSDHSVWSTFGVRHHGCWYFIMKMIFNTMWLTSWIRFDWPIKPVLKATYIL